MIKKILSLTILLFLTGCYNYHELNDLAIASAIGIDKDNNEYLVSLEVVNTKNNNQESNSDASFVIYKAKGKTIEEAINNLSYTCPKKIYLSHLEVIIYGEDMAKDGLKNTLDYFARNIDIRGDTIVCIAKNYKAKDILEVITPIDKINSHSIYNLVINANNSLGKTTAITFDELLSNYLSNNKEIVIPSITIEGSKDDDINNIQNTNPSSILRISEEALFKDDKLVAFLDNDKTLGYNILTNNIKQTNIEYKCQNNYIGVLINKINTKITPQDNLNVKIDVKVQGSISEINCDLDLNQNKVIEEINHKVANKIKQIVTSTLDETKKYNLDFIGIRDVYYKNNNKYFNLIKNDIKNINYHIDVDVNLINKENILKAVNNEK